MAGSHASKLAGYCYYGSGVSKPTSVSGSCLIVAATLGIVLLLVAYACLCVYGDQEQIPEDLLVQLLRKQRLLVIVDHLSEMSETTRKQIRPELPSFSVNALILRHFLNLRWRN